MEDCCLLYYLEFYHLCESDNEAVIIQDEVENHTQKQIIE